MIRTSNPVLRENTFTRFGDQVASKSGVMTLQGTVLCTFVLLGICSATAIAVWSWLVPSLELIKAGKGVMPPLAMPVLLGCCFGGLALAVLISFVPRTAPYISPIYAVAQGGVVGAVSAMTAVFYKAGPTLVLQAGLLTFGILAALLLAYCSRLIKATENFKLGVVAATGGIVFVWIGSMVLRMFGIHIPYLWDNGLIGIGFAAFIVVIASLNLVLDFDFIENGAERGLPKYMEWYGAFGLLVTLVWLYLSILRLLKLLSGRD